MATACWLLRFAKCSRWQPTPPVRLSWTGPTITKDFEALQRMNSTITTLSITPLPKPSPRELIASWCQGRTQPPFHFPQFTASVATAPAAWKMATHNNVLEKIVRLSSIKSIELAITRRNPPISWLQIFCPRESYSIPNQVPCLASF
jgi:hypothetical protein